MTEADLAPQQRTLWLKGMSALQLKNFEYAISLALELLQQVPAFLDARRLLRRAESGKFMQRPQGRFSGSGIMVGFKLWGGTKKATPWECIADLEEKVFSKDPYNIAGNNELHDLAMRLGELELAEFALLTIREGHPDNTENLHKVAAYYLAQSQPQKAVETYANIISLDPADLEAVQLHKQATALMSIKDVGQVRNHEAAIKLQHSDRDGMTPEQQRSRLDTLLAELKHDARNFSALKKIADLYCLMGYPENAVRYYDLALQINPGDVALANLAEQACHKALEKQIESLEAAIASAPEDAPDLDLKRARVQEMKVQRAEIRLSKARSRVERNPLDKHYRFDLGAALFEEGQYRKAIPELQQAKANPHLRSRALLLLGKCFLALRMNDLAITALSEAAGDFISMTKEKVEIIYELGIAYEKMGRHEQSLDCMKEIYHADYGYRDVAQRVECSYSQE